MRLKGKVALISGGGSGIGAATARRLRVKVQRCRDGSPSGADRGIAASVGGVAVVGDTRDAAHSAKAVATALPTFGRARHRRRVGGLGFLGSAGDIDDAPWQRDDSTPT